MKRNCRALQYQLANQDPQLVTRSIHELLLDQHLLGNTRLQPIRTTSCPFCAGVHGNTHNKVSPGSSPAKRNHNPSVMAQLINYCAAAGHKIHSTIVRLLTSDQCCQAKPVPSGQPRQSLSSMPTEILLQITDFLPPSSAACLVLCSRHILTALGNQSLSSLRADDQIIERRRFLIALQNDLPDWLLCYPCSLFHPMKAHERPDQIWRHHKEALFVQENGAVYLTTDYGIRYQHVQLFMKEYRIERSYTKILDTLSFSFS